MSDMEYTKKLADFCAGLSYDDLPPEVVDKTKICILDFFANAYGSLELEPVRKIAEMMKTLSAGGNCTVAGCGYRDNMKDAAFVNGTAAEAIEAQDGLRFGGNHPGAAVIPATLAVAEHTGAGGRAVIEAVVAGYEAANRIAAAMHPHHTLAGFLPTGTCGAPGAAAAASKLLGHGAGDTLNSISCAGYLAPLSMAEQLMGGFAVKIVQGGQGAASGISAALLADAGIDGAPWMLEGSHLKGGFTQITTSADPDLSKVVNGLGGHFTIQDVYIKPFTSCRHTHAAAQAMLRLREESPLAASDIEEINVHTYAIACVAVAKETGVDTSFVTAQFSVPYVVAACLVDGAMGPAQLTEARLRDPGILALAKKVKMNVDAEIQGMYPEKTGARVEVNTSGGAARSAQIDIPKGDPRDPMSFDDVKQKLEDFASGATREKIGQIASMVADLDLLENINELMKNA